MEETKHIPAPSPEEGFDRHEPRSGVIALVSGATVLLLLTIVIGVYWFYMVEYERTEQAHYTGVASKELQAIHEREDEHLYRYTYIDKDKGVVRIPIDRAMDLIVNDYRDNGKVFYNTTAYPAKQEALGGAAGGATPQTDAPAQPAAQPAAAPTTANAPAAH